MGPGKNILLLQDIVPALPGERPRDSDHACVIRRWQRRVLIFNHA